MFPLVTDVISGATSRDRDGGHRVRAAPRPIRREVRLRPIRRVPVPSPELVLLGQAGGRGPWLTGKANAISTEASQVVRELNGRNIFASSQAQKVSPDEALRWGVDFALYRMDPKKREGYDRTKPFAGTIRYATAQYLSNKDFIAKSRYAIAAARRVVGSPKSEARAPDKASMGGVKSQLPHRYRDVIVKKAVGL